MFKVTVAVLDKAAGGITAVEDGVKAIQEFI